MQRKITMIDCREALAITAKNPINNVSIKDDVVKAINDDLCGIAIDKRKATLSLIRND